eukprot:3319408-Lingulodinium_polyedra.AAC.1
MSPGAAWASARSSRRSLSPTRRAPGTGRLRDALRLQVPHLQPPRRRRTWPERIGPPSAAPRGRSMPSPRP